MSEPADGKPVRKKPAPAPAPGSKSKPVRKKPATQPAPSSESKPVNKKAASKSTALARRMTDADRIEEVFNWILSGITEHALIKKIEETWPEVDRRPLIIQAVKRFSSCEHLNPTAVMGFCFEASRDLYRRMVEAGDFVNALRAVKQMADLARKQL
jgi:hypothetical protein